MFFKCKQRNYYVMSLSPVFTENGPYIIMNVHVFNSRAIAYAQQMISKHPFIKSFRKKVFVVVYRKMFSRSAMKLFRSAYCICVLYEKKYPCTIVSTSIKSLLLHTLTLKVPCIELIVTCLLNLAN